YIRQGLRKKSGKIYHLYFHFCNLRTESMEMIVYILQNIIFSKNYREFWTVLVLKCVNPSSGRAIKQNGRRMPLLIRVGNSL
ncbi:hypothetical protein, partial [Asaia platycodi]|uniref:hypothetical protein n=1 Tax=Asaia platycodi TaxID=610243 RepID=UPI001A7F02CE